VSESGMPRKRKPLDHDPGLLARTLLAARHKAGLNGAQCARLCELSTSFLHMIERGTRTPELNRIPAIAKAYQTDVTELCWTWLLQHAPETVRYLAKTSSYDDSRVLRNAAEQRYVDELAQKAEVKAAAQKARMQAVLDKPLPVVAPFKHGGDYQPVGERDPMQQSPLTPRGGAAVEGDRVAIKRK
jgi:transcriptional regulator with XRE-family HTH domain